MVSPTVKQRKGPSGPIAAPPEDGFAGFGMFLLAATALAATADWQNVPAGSPGLFVGGNTSNLPPAFSFDSSSGEITCLLSGNYMMFVTGCLKRPSVPPLQQFRCGFSVDNDIPLGSTGLPFSAIEFTSSGTDRPQSFAVLRGWQLTAGAIVNVRFMDVEYVGGAPSELVTLQVGILRGGPIA